MTKIYVTGSSIARQGTSSNDKPVHREGEVPVRWRILEEGEDPGPFGVIQDQEEDDPIDDEIFGWIKQHIWDEAGKPLVLEDHPFRFIDVLWEDERWNKTDKIWNLDGLVIFRSSVTLEGAERIYADACAYWARRERSLSRRQSADHMGGRPRLRYGWTRHLRRQGDCPERLDHDC